MTLFTALICVFHTFLTTVTKAHEIYRVENSYDVYCFPQALAFIPPVRDFFLREENYQNIKRPPGDIMFPLGTGIAFLSVFCFLEVVDTFLFLVSS